MDRAEILTAMSERDIGVAPFATDRICGPWS